MKTAGRKQRMLTILQRRSFQKSRARNIVAILAIMMTTLMFTTLFVLTQSMQKNVIEMAFRQTGYDAHVSIKNIDSEQVKAIAGHPDVKSAGESIVVGLGGESALAGRQVEIRYAQDQYAKNSFSAPEKGRLPQAADEIALDSITLDSLGIPHELGQQVTLEWRKDFASGELLKDTFTLCGYWEGNANVYASMAWVSMDFAQKQLQEAGLSPQHSSGEILGLHTMSLSLADDKNIQEDMEAILSELGLSDIVFSVNLAYDPSMQAMAVQENLPMYLGMVLVFAAGYLVIYNIFQISVTSDIRYYGQLKTLGTTKKQLRKLILGQAQLLCAVGIPLGLTLGYLLGVILVPALVGGFSNNAVVSFHPVIFIGSAIFAWLTVLFSCLRPAGMASRVSPIEALRYSDTQNVKKKSKKGENGATIQGMAWGNLGRNRKRTVTVICSLTLALVLLACFYAKNESFDMEKYLSSQMISDFQISDATSEDYINSYNPRGTTITQELTAQIDSLEGVTATGRLYSQEQEITLSEQTLMNIKNFYESNDRLEAMSYNPAWVNAYRETVESKKSGGVFYGADGLSLDRITDQANLIEGSFDPALFATGDYLLAVTPPVETAVENKETMPVPGVGELVTVNGRTFQVMALLLPLSPIMEGACSYSFSLDFVLPAETFREMYPDNTIRKYYFNAESQKQEAVEEFLSDYRKNTDHTMPYQSKKVLEEQYNTQTRASAVMGNAISVVIGLVGILNFVNSMMTAIVSRRKEFAMIQSVGMTKSQLKKMLVMEGVDYALLTLLSAYILSILAVGIGVRAMVEGGYTTFRFTLMPLYICTPILLILAVMIPFICFKNLEKQSIVERLRDID